MNTIVNNKKPMKGDLIRCTSNGHEGWVKKGEIHICTDPRSIDENIWEVVSQYKICTEVRTSRGNLDTSETAKKAMKLTVNVTKTKDELKDFMIQWQKHKAKDFPAGKVIVTSFTKKGELHEQYSLCEDGRYQVVCRNDNPKFYLENS